VPDTVTGRFDMICLHMSLVFRRLRSERKDVAVFSQALFDLFFRDMDRSLREMGATDLGVPKKIQKMGNIFYGLLAHLNQAMDKGDRGELEAVLTRNIYEGEANPAVADLAAYLFAEAERLEAQPLESILAGQLAMGAEAA
jgi:cytochrome b pre-mRNA-processing protein 3